MEILDYFKYLKNDIFEIQDIFGTTHFIGYKINFMFLFISKNNNFHSNLGMFRTRLIQIY